MRAKRMALLAMPVLLLSAAFAAAQTRTFIEDAILTPLDGAPEGNFGRSADIDGDIAVVGATWGSPTPENARRGAAYVFERDPSTGRWLQIAKLLPLYEPPPPEGWGSSNFGTSVAIEGNTLVVGSHYSGQTAIFERAGGIWSRAATLTDTNGYYVDISNGTVIASHEDGGDLYRRGSSGWTRVQRIANGIPMGDIDYSGARVAISPTTAIHGSYGFDGGGPPYDVPGTAYIYRLNANGVWDGSAVAAITRPGGGTGADGFSSVVAIDDERAVIGGGTGTYIYEREQGTWYLGPQIPNGAADVEDGTVAVTTPDGEVFVYKQNSPRRWSHMATLVASTGDRLGRPRIRGNRIVAGAYVFTLPEAFPHRPTSQENFEDGVANDWAPQVNSTFTVANVGGTNVYRQTNVSSGASAIYQGVDWDSQSIQADVTPRAYATPSGDRWFGLMVRYTDPQNYYYVTVRNSNLVELKRMVNGSYTTIASAPLAVVLNRTYVLRLEAHSTRLRVFVDGNTLIDVVDDPTVVGPVPMHGRAGLAMFKTQADYDNIVVSANPSRLLSQDNFNASRTQATWTNVSAAPQQWVKDPTAFAQPSTTGGAHAYTGASVGDQIIRARMRATAFDGADRWFGIIGRFVNASNYYYLTVRSNNSVSLRKLANGTITTLDTAPMTVSLNTWYDLRLEIVGASLRAYVNNQLVLEATDSTHATGRFGFGSYKTAAEADDLKVIQP
ncbi:MAG TPA: FG-GAP repeat protein [Steroidobacter sp.]|uniref:FG-GAP repeat protein n=1 Tax=Steroidobacter sp. TaxID=1978227 RepID=UPI002ED9822F